MRQEADGVRKLRGRAVYLLGCLGRSFANDAPADRCTVGLQILFHAFLIRLISCRAKDDEGRCEGQARTRSVA